MRSLTAGWTGRSDDQRSLSLATELSRDGELAFLQGMKSCRAHFSGDRKREDLFETVHWWRIASDAGYAEAQYQLAKLFLLPGQYAGGRYIGFSEDWKVDSYSDYPGDDFEYPDKVDPYALLLEAARQGHALAQLEVGLCGRYSSRPESYGREWDWLLKAALQGVVDAKIELWRLFDEGDVQAEDALAAQQLLVEGAAEAAKAPKFGSEEWLASFREKQGRGPFGAG